MLYTEPRARTPVMPITENGANGHEPKRLKIGIIGCGQIAPVELPRFSSPTRTLLRTMRAA